MTDSSKTIMPLAFSASFLCRVIQRQKLFEARFIYFRLLSDGLFKKLCVLVGSGVELNLVILVTIMMRI